MKDWLKGVIAVAIVLAALVFYFGARGVFTTTLTTTSFTAIALLVSVTSLTYQILHSSLVQSADLLMRFEHDFFGAEKIKQRSLAAQRLLADPSDFRELEDILDFFETVAMFTRKRALNTYMVWHTFDYWIERYYAVAKPYIKERQISEPGTWEDIDWLVVKLEKLRAKKQKTTPIPFTPEALSAFLAEESVES
jgi:hypothetical protein